MKIIVFIAALFIVMYVSAQNDNQYEFSQACISWGRGALTSGMDISVELSNNKHLIRLTGNTERGYLDYGFKWGNFTPEISFGYFKNIP